MKSRKTRSGVVVAMCGALSLAAAALADMPEIRFASQAPFKDGKREKLLSLIRVYFSRGGQEIQINSTSREVLEDAMDHPQKYPDLVVRVSGFSAVYVTLGREVQEDILSRTQHEAV